MANFPLIVRAVNKSFGAVTGSITRGDVKRGWVYRVVPTTACWINFEGAAAAGTGMYLPANEETFMTFGAADSQGTDVLVNVIRVAADGVLNLTPFQRVPTM
jgi:hypothetical protein